MAAGATYTPIATTTLGSDTASITFSSISGSYTDLVLICNGAGTANANLTFQLNSDTGTNYSATMLKGNGTTASSYRFSNGTAGQIGETNSSSTALGTWVTQFQNYSNATTYKSVLTRSNTTVTEGTAAWVSLWRSTSAVTAIKIACDSGNLRSGFTATLYGIAAA